jgi:hypothetical protein
MSECLLDYPHAPVWCPACWAEQQQDQVITEMRRANDLKEQELLLRDQHDDGWRPAPKPVRYIPPMTTPAQQHNEKGGIGIEPRHKSL